jgi:hypothetical protein
MQVDDRPELLGPSVSGLDGSIAWRPISWPCGGSIFLRRGADLVEMVERRYDSEDVLQELLARYPNLLARDQVDPGEPRRWLLVTREGGIPDREGGPDRWSIDHVFLDQDSVPTLVEVKRSTDTRIRREVVGQLLDYAANILAFWSVQRIRDAFEERCRREDIEPETELMTVLGETAPDDYWERVKTNLEARRLRLVFVADVIPIELQRVVEFLNDQMTRSQVIAIEVKQFASDDGAETTIVPRVIGQTAAAQQVKAAGQSGPTRQWDETSFFEDLARRADSNAVQAARALLQWARSRDIEVWWGQGKRDGSLVPIIRSGPIKTFLFTAWTYGKMEINFEYMTSGPFADEAKRRELLERINAATNSHVQLGQLSHRPPLSLAALASPEVLARLLQVFDWYLAEIQVEAKTAR